MSLPSEQNWLVLNHLLKDLVKKGYKIPDGINFEMGIIRSTISSYKRDPSHPDLIDGLAKAEMSLNNIQGTLLSLAEQEGEEYEDHWLDLLKQVMQGKEVYQFADSRSKFLVNTPPGLTTGRINLLEAIAEERVQEIAEWEGLIIEFDDDVTIQLHGDKPNLQNGLKEMGSFFLEQKGD